VNNLNEIEAGWDAYGNDGEKIGSIYDRAENYLVLEKGVFSPKEIYVPADAIERADPDGQRVYLSVAKDDIGSMGWDQPTAGGAESDVDFEGGDGMASGASRSSDRAAEPAGTMATSRLGYGTDGNDEAAEVAGGGMGAVGGAAVGAAVGGPVGAAAGGVIGAAAGAVTGKGAEGASDEEDDETVR
jgi:hypothetical protein